MVRHLGTFLTVSALVIVTPGPDTALTIRNTLLGGRRGGLFTAVGVSTGQATWAFGAAVGVAALLQAAHPVFTTIRLAGALYLILLGGQALLAAWRAHRVAARVPAGSVPNSELAAPVALRQGLISNLTNPKMAIFFTSLLPQFAAPDAPAFVALLSLGVAFSLMTLVWLTSYAIVVAKTGDFLRRPAVRRTLEALAGFALVGLGLGILLELA
jgi:threonine/homoserine/homoserine lactone efflux protein